MHSMESQNWITALVVGILGLALASCGTVIAYKQLKRTKRTKRTKRPDDVEAAESETIELREVAAVIEGTENSHAISEISAETRDGAQHETEAVQVGDSSPEAPLSATIEGGQI